MGISPFQMFQPFNRFAPFKTFQTDLGIKAMYREVVQHNGTLVLR